MRLNSKYILENTKKNPIIIFKILLADKKNKILKEIFSRCFYKVKEVSIVNLMKFLQNELEKNDKASGINLHSLSIAVYDWYYQLSSSDLKSDLPKNDEYVKSKADKISKLIIKKIPQKDIELNNKFKILSYQYDDNNRNHENLKNDSFLDIGCGDGSLSYFIHSQTNTNAKGVDIEHDILYGENSIFKNKIKFTTYKNSLQEIPIEFKKNNLFITYNHSMHHFGSINLISKSLAEAMDLLKQNGLIFITEHQHNLDSAILNLFHLFIHMNCLLNSTSFGKDKFVEMVEKYSQELPNITYLSKHLIYKLAVQNGAEVIAEQKSDQTNNDITSSTFYVLKKREKTFIEKLYLNCSRTWQRHLFFGNSSLAQDDSSLLCHNSEFNELRLSP